jgi:hypothetical protein
MAPSRLKYPVLGALAAAAPATSSAAIVVFDTNDVTLDHSSGYQSTFFSSINISNGTFSNLPLADPFIGANTVQTYYGSRFSIFSTVGVVFLGEEKPFGSLVDSSTELFDNFVGKYTFLLPQGVFYLALRLTQDSQNHYGWIQFTHSGTDIIFNQFAFENTPGASIVVGSTSAIPEASTLGFAGGLFGLIAAAHLRRRRQKQDAASDRFLALAAGEKLN